MTTRPRLIGFLVLLALLQPLARAQTLRDRSTDGLWKRLSVMPAARGRQKWIHPQRFRGFQLDPDLLALSLGQAPSESIDPAKRAEIIVSLPTPDGGFERFSVVESPVMEDELAAKFPTIHTYAATGVDDPTAKARLDFTPLGFHAQVFSSHGRYFIDPYWRNDTVNYASYYSRYFVDSNKTWMCGVQAEVKPLARAASAAKELARQNGDTLRKFRLAVAAQGEYTAFFGGTVTGALAGIVTTVNRVNQLYENDLAIRLLLIANENLIIYTNSSTDPYTVNNATGLTLNQNQNNIDSVIGTNNYDIGHVVNTGGGGLAGLGVVCVAGQKARGCTGSSSPVGDPFDIDYVAHEMGHEFGADHPFNGTQGSCSGANRNGPTAYEPGSGSTIMAYAGICGVDDLQPHSDSYFLFASVTQILGYVTTTGTCSTNVATGNSMPTVDAGPNYTIPKSTPFVLTASGTDADPDVLTYCWEEQDLGPAALLTAADDGQIPLFRSFSPTTNTSRTFPQLSNILGGKNSNDEKLPALARTMTFHVTVRDNRSGGGGVNDAIMQVTVVTSAGPFVVTLPTTGVLWSGSSTVTWNNANTQLSPVNATNVNIYLSTDGGQTFDTTLATNTPNDGTQVVVLPNISTTNARVRIQPVSNVFFDISDGNFSIQPSGAFFAGTGVNTIDDSSGNHSGGIDPGESANVYVEIRNGGTAGGAGISATLTSLTALATVIAPASAYPNLAPLASGSNSTAFIVHLSSSYVCTNPVGLRLSVTADTGTNSFDFAITPGAPSPPVTNSFAVAVNIPDNNGLGTNIPFVIAGLGTIADVDFSFDGSACTTNSKSATVGLSHSWVGDLVVKLTSPAGTNVVIINRPGGGSFGSSGNNFCNTRLNDDGAFTSIQSIVPANEPNTGTWLPANPLSAFDGQPANGTWTLNVSDNSGSDTGTVHAFSLIITSGGCSAATNAPDTDGDGIPDDWEIEHGLNAGASNAPVADADGDRVPDLSEYIADTVPTNNASFFKLDVISNTGPRSIVFSPSSTGRVYTLQYIDDLVLGNWSNVAGEVNLPGDGNSQDVLNDTNSPPDARHYRIGVKLP